LAAIGERARVRSEGKYSHVVKSPSIEAKKERSKGRQPRGEIAAL